MITPLIRQTTVMMKKNLTLNLRYFKSVMAQCIIAPIVFVLLLLILQAFYEQRQKTSLRNPYSYSLGGVPQCRGKLDTSPCISLMYSPDTPYLRFLMKILDQRNKERIGVLLNVEQFEDSKRKMGIVGVPSADFIYDHIANNRNQTQFAVVFQSELPSVSYQIWYNHTLTANGSDIYDGILPLQRAIDEAIIISSGVDLNTEIRNLQGNLDYQIKDWPIVPPNMVPDVIVQNMGPMFFFCSVMVIFISCLQQVTTEKELKLRHAMQLMGLDTIVYWFTHFLNQMMLIFVASLVTVVMGLICNFTQFTRSSFFAMFLLFFMFGMAMISFAFFLTTLCRKSRAAVLSGMFVFIIGLLFQSFVFSSSFVGFIWFAETTSKSLYRAFTLLPFFNFGILYMSIGLFTTGKFDTLTQTSIQGPGFSFSDLNSRISGKMLPSYLSESPDLVPKPAISLCLLFMDTIIYLLLTLYLDKVIPDEYGKRESLFFFFKRNKQHNIQEFLDCKKLSELKEFQVENEDEEVKKERTNCFDLNIEKQVRIGNLRKEYRGIFKSKNDKVAVKSLCLTLQEGSLLALLGQNGAGKSTTMSCLSGLSPPTAGDAVFYGLSITKNMQKLQKIMGICPQHDILFNDLTAFEHIELYGGLKNLSKQEIQRVAEERLGQVKLLKVQHLKSGTYSGGMKRRLSVVISTLGDPKVIFLDEPTTGMDPVNRRHVWSFLEKFKENRVVVLTTHSMEEADVLGDQVAIMSKGLLKALGTGVQLKSKHGEGYRVSIIAKKLLDAQRLVKKHVQDAVLEDEAAGSLIYRVPPSIIEQIPLFVNALEMGKDCIESWGLSQTTLEEVFLKIIKD